jgi:hypothetical protein
MKLSRMVQVCVPFTRRTCLLRKMRSSPSAVFHDATCAPWRNTSHVNPVDDVRRTPGRPPPRAHSESDMVARVQTNVRSTCSKQNACKWETGWYRHLFSTIRRMPEAALPSSGPH